MAPAGLVKGWAAGLSETLASGNSSTASNRAASADGSARFNWAASARSSESCTCTIFIPLTYHRDISKPALLRVPSVHAGRYGLIVINLKANMRTGHRLVAASGGFRLAGV